MSGSLQTDAGTLAGVLEERAQRTPDALAYAFLADGRTETARLTWGELHQRALGLAGVLLRHAAPGDRVLLMLPPGLDVVVGVQACFAAGLVGVPIAPPTPRRLAVALAAAARVAVDAQAVCVLGEPAPAAEALPPALAQLPWVVAADAPTVAPNATPAPPSPDDLAYLQYTSGSTSEPRGVMLPHRAFMANIAAIHEAFGFHAGTRMYSWLPPWHDMGLVGGILSGLGSGTPTFLAPPAAIARRPLTWLQAISELQITISGGPDFMYRLVAERATPERLAGIDLSSWEVAFSGAEPVRASTLDRVVHACAPAGLRRSALLPCYGLAEATLLVTGTPPDQAPQVRRYDRRALALGTAQAADSGAIELVGCGGAPRPTQVAIVQGSELDGSGPTLGTRCADGVVGEIWVSGPSVARGFWQRPQETAATFGAQIAGEPGTSWLRTGDLGFIERGELCIVGRAKDVLIVRGANYHPVDLEAAVQESHPLLRARASAVFAAEELSEEVVVVVEVAAELPADGAPGADSSPLADELLAAVRRGVAAATELTPRRVVLVPSGAIPKTTSGKVRRAVCREALGDGSLPVLAEWALTDRATTASGERA